MDVMIDSNIILDIATEDPNWFEWSSETLAFYADTHMFVINTVIYAEVSVGYEKIEDVDAILPSAHFRKMPVPREAAFNAGKAFLVYRKRGGEKRSPLPDFFIGAHASFLKIPLMTRDASRYRTYFPELMLISPKEIMP